MSNTYIPLIKRTKWVDLSDDHKRVRETIQNDLKSACEGGNVQPIMLQGAFGIGKSTMLYYLFHYGWEILKTPTFYMPLSKIVEYVKCEAYKNPSQKVENDKLSIIIKQMIDAQLEMLRSQSWQELTDVYFPDFKNTDDSSTYSLVDYLNDFSSVVLDSENDDTNLFEGIVFSEKIIKEGFLSNNPPILLVDEFESKFYELKKIVASSGGGFLRQLFDDIVVSKPFLLVIGNGPASGYEVSKERTDSGDSETAAIRRLKKLPVPFPTVNLLKRKFLKDSPNGYVNFIWWLSRCRPGHIQKLKDTIDYKIYSQYNTTEFIIQPIFNDAIEDGGEDVKYLKISFFDHLESHISTISSKLLIDFEPQTITVRDEFKDHSKDWADYFYCAEELISVENELAPAIKDDVSNYLEDCQKEGKYTTLKYTIHFGKYFNFILSACANANGEIAFSTAGKNREKYLSETFIRPLFELTYDFISQYEDDEDPAIKEAKDFILDCIKHTEDAQENERIEELYENTYDLFETTRLRSGNDTFFQFSLLAIREFIEQPIGSPVLKYKDSNLEYKLNSCSFNKCGLMISKSLNKEIIFVPILQEAQLKLYVNCLRNYIDEVKESIHKEAQSVLHIVFLQENDMLDRLRKDVCHDSAGNMLPICKFSKLSFELFDNYQFNFNRQLLDFIDSLSKIAIIGCEQNAFSDIVSTNLSRSIDIKDVITSIKDREWTKQKEVIRTIEHYEKLVCEGENSVINVINSNLIKNFENAFEDNICERDYYREEITCDFTSLDSPDVTDNLSRYVAYYYVLESAKKQGIVNSSLLNILDMIGTSRQNLKMEANEDTISQSLHFDQIRSILNRKKEVELILDKLDLNSDVYLKIYHFVQTMLEDEDIRNNSAASIMYFMKDNLTSHWIGDYNSMMSSSGFLKGDILFKMMYLHCMISKTDFTDLRNDLNNEIQNNEVKLIELRSKVNTVIGEIKDLLYSPDYQKRFQDRMPFPSCSNNLQKISMLLNVCKKLYQEQSTSIAVLVILYAIISRIKDIVKSTNVLLSQFESIKISLTNCKNNIQKMYQNEIDSIYKDSLSVKLIYFGIQTNNQGQSTDKSYEGEYCWRRYRKALTSSKEEINKILNKDVIPAQCEYFSQYDIDRFKSVVISTYNSMSTVFSNILISCRNAKDKSNEFSQIQKYIVDLLNFNQDGNQDNRE